MIKVISSSFSTFHMVEQARQLERLNILKNFITGIPKFPSSKHQLPKDKVISIWKSFAISYMNNKFRFLSNQFIFDYLVKTSHITFSKDLAKNLKNDADFFIGLSSFSYHALLKANKIGITSIIDHGSLHQRFELNEIIKESEKYGFKIGGNSRYNWLIEEQDNEFEKANKVLVLSNLAKETFIKEGVDESKILVNNLGVSVNQFRPFKKEDNVYRVLFCGNLVPAKGLHYLLKSFTKLNLPNSELWLIGDQGYLKNDKTFNEYIKKYCSNKVIFKGVFPSNKISRYFSQCSLLVLPSLADGFGKVVCEAMACKLPVIVSENTGAKDFVINDFNGYIVPNRDSYAISGILEKLYLNPSKLIYLGDNAYKYAKNNCTWDKYGDRLYNLLMQNLNK